MSDYNKKGFEKAFRKAIPNFNELIAHFEHKSKLYEPSKVVFVWNNKLWKFEMYKSQFEIDIWGKHFVDFFISREFDYNGYWRKYTTNSKGGNQTPFGPIFKIPLCKKHGNDFYEHSPELDKLYKMPEGEGIGGKYGLMLVPKPDNNTIEIITIS